MLLAKVLARQPHSGRGGHFGAEWLFTGEYLAMKRFFSFQNKFLFTFLVLVNLPFVISAYLANNIAENALMQEKENKLFSLGGILVANLGDGGYEAILQARGAENASREEQIAVLNRELTEFTDLVSKSSPGLGIGYYSKKLDAIITYGPSEQYAHALGRPIAADHPGRLTMSEGKRRVQSGEMVRGFIMNAMTPLKAGGETVGYVWANELITDITSQAGRIRNNMALGMGVCFGLSSLLLMVFFHYWVRDVGRIVDGIGRIRGNLSARIPPTSGKLGEVISNLNSLAADIEKATGESKNSLSILRNVMSNVGAAIYVCDPQTKELVFLNAYLLNLLGKTEVEKGLCYEVLHGRTEPCDFCPQSKLIDENGEPHSEPLHWEFHNAAAGRDFLVMDRMVPWHDGRLMHLEVATDVTERNALVLAEAANTAQRDFVARMSHELRTPMNGVLGMTKLAMQADPPPAQLQYLRKIQSSASLLLGIINDILDFSRIEAGKLTIESRIFSIHEIVENIRELIAPRTQEKSLDLILSIDDSVPEFAVGDGLRFSQVLLNLLGNASKFTLTGFIELALKAEPLSGGQFRLHCSVRDSGIGMSEEQQAALFKPFTQADVSTSRKFGGTGLGLSISKALVELMGGAIDLQSEEEKGSVFFFHLDLGIAEKAADEAKKEQARWETAHYGGKRVLLVEDNEINQEIATELLKELGVTVEVAENGQLGVQAFLNNHYDLILMDVRMPVMDGLEAATLIRKSEKRGSTTVPIVAMTANAMREDRDACTDAGMDDHVAKPIDIAELKKALYTHLGEHTKEPFPG